MDTGERLAAYLSGDLPPDEQQALEAELAGDAALRARLARIRRADEALAALPAVELPDGFGDRLRAAVQPALDEVLGDELAVRRARRMRAAWLPRVGAAAAVLAVVAAGIGIGIGIGGRGGEDVATLAEATAPGVAGLAPEGDLAESGFGYAGPTVVDRGRALSDDDVTALADVPEVQSLLAAGITAEQARMLEQSLRANDDQAVAEADGAPAADASAGLTVDGELSPDEYGTYARCLPELLGSDDRPLLPIYAEFATWQDEPVIAYVLLAVSPNDKTLQRLEIWLLGVDDCQLRHFVQRDG